ncbi:hypothetical protein GCM10018784_69230 [Streptomyces hydrogenans]|nr:hypothetical protein GCM10018784_69230 [Streptomyces hydrogenans]
MLAAERHDYLLELLGREGEFVAKDVAVRLKISEDTVRRGLRDLAGEGLCQRVYGGALPVSSAVADYRTRQAVAPTANAGSPPVAARLVRPGGVVVLGGGATALAVAHALPTDLACTVITHSPTIAAALLDHPKVKVFAIGGRLFKRSPSPSPRRSVRPPDAASCPGGDQRPDHGRPPQDPAIERLVAAWSKPCQRADRPPRRRGRPHRDAPVPRLGAPAVPARAPRRAVAARPAPPLRFVASWHSPGAASH